MIRLYPKSGSPGGCAWIDLIDPTPDEIATAEQRCGLRVPTRAELSEIEATSRLRSEGDALYLSAPLIAGTANQRWRLAPAGFVLSAAFLLTVRFDGLDSFDAVHRRLEGSECAAPAIFTQLVEEIVDRAADHLERAAEAITDASHEIFAEPDDSPRRLSQDARRLRGLMIDVGRASERASRVRYTFLSMGRMADFVADKASDWLDPGIVERLGAVRHDISSLDEFEDSLSTRVQLLQDAAANFVNIEQNDVVKVLTIVSAIGVPPVLVVGVYGMNFKFMPELEWHYGYPLALALTVLSAVVPLVWFKLRGWL